MQMTKKGCAKPIAALIALFPGLFCVLFSKWISVVLFYQSSSATLWKIGALLKNVASFAAQYGMDDLSGSLTAATVLTYILLIGTLILMFLTIRSILAAFRSGGDISTAGFWGAMVLSGVVLILVWATNSTISKETDGWINDVFMLTSAPGITLLCSAAGLLCCKYLPEQAFDNVTLPKVDLSSIGESAHSTVEKMGAALSRMDFSGSSAAPCAFCGKRALAQDYRFCPYCGKERLTKRFCEECGEELELDMQFCPHCGTAVRKDF